MARRKRKGTTPAEQTAADEAATQAHKNIQGDQRNVSSGGGDCVEGGMVQGDLIGQQFITQYQPPAPIDPVAAAQRLAALPDTIPDLAALPIGSRMPLARNPLFVGHQSEQPGLAAPGTGRPECCAALPGASTGDRRKVLGEQHPSTARSLNNLGMLLKDVGDLSAARRYLEQALAIFEYVLGPDHPNTQVVRHNLAGLDASAQTGAQH